MFIQTSSNVSKSFAPTSRAKIREEAAPQDSFQATTIEEFYRARREFIRESAFTGGAVGAGVMFLVAALKPIAVVEWPVSALTRVATTTLLGLAAGCILGGAVGAGLAGSERPRQGGVSFQDLKAELQR